MAQTSVKSNPVSVYIGIHNYTIFGIQSMQPKPFFWLLFLGSFQVFAQGYVDLARVGFGNTFANSFEGFDATTDVTALELDVNIPVPISKSQVFVTGFTFSRNALDLFPNSFSTSLYSSMLKVGLSSTWNEKWSSTIVALPKMASDFRDITSNDLYIGGFALVKMKKRDNLIYRFGAYGSTEAFGFFCTPIVGWYYMSPSQGFEMDVSLPISADINYDLGKVTIGMDYFGIGRSFNVRAENDPEVYVDLSSLDFAAYAQVGFMKNTVLARAKLGYSSSKYEVYERGDTIDLGLSAFSFGDDRTQLNPNLQGGIFLKFELLYRFHLNTLQKEAP